MSRQTLEDQFNNSMQLESADNSTISVQPKHMIVVKVHQIILHQLNLVSFAELTFYFAQYCRYIQVVVQQNPSQPGYS